MVNHPSRRREAPRAATLAAVLARALPDARPSAIAWAVGRMIDAAKAAKRWETILCNNTMWSERQLERCKLQAHERPLTDEQRARGDRRCERLADAAVACLRDTIGHAKGGGCDDPVAGIAIAGRIIRLTFGGDPRGPCGMLHISDMPGDGFGPGWAIYE